MEHDRFGHPVSTRSAAAAAAYREGVDRVLSAWPGADAALGRAIAEDEGFALAHAAMARFHQIYARVADARAAMARARALEATPRERSHIAVLGFSVDGQPAKALEALLQHIGEWPRDALPLSLALGAFGLYAFSGRADHDALRVALCERVAPHYGEDWWMETFRGWSFTEARDLAAGEKHTARALELRPANAHAAHAMGHWFAEAGRKADGAGFIAGWLPSYSREGTLYSHLNWHCTLAFLEAGDPARALSVFDERLRPSVTAAPPINRISDSASLLWRLSLTQPVPAELWQPVAAYAGETFPGPAPHFIEWHIAMALAAVRDAGSIEKRLADIRAREVSGGIPTGGVLEAVVRGLAAFGRGEFREAVAQLAPHADDFVRLGGSGAQRRILHDTLAVARKRS